ncbi:MAG: ATPase, T2SS/T4P/T4SS family [Butyricicoccus sp.]
MYDLQTLIFYAKEKNTSDVHLTVGLPPMLRIDGELRTHGDVPLTEQDVQDATQQLADEHQLHELKTIGESDFAVTFADSGACAAICFASNTTRRWRCVCCRWKSRLRSSRLPDIIIQQAEKPRGLVIVTYPTGSGKSSTLAALIDHVNRTAARHIITLENPIEYVHPRIRSMINQRNRRGLRQLRERSAGGSAAGPGRYSRR